MALVNQVREGCGWGGKQRERGEHGCDAGKMQTLLSNDAEKVETRLRFLGDYEEMLEMRWGCEYTGRLGGWWRIMDGGNRGKGKGRKSGGGSKNGAGEWGDPFMRSGGQQGAGHSVCGVAADFIMLAAYEAECRTVVEGWCGWVPR